MLAFKWCATKETDYLSRSDYLRHNDLSKTWLDVSEENCIQVNCFEEIEVEEIFLRFLKLEALAYLLPLNWVMHIYSVDSNTNIAKLSSSEDL